MGTIIRGNKYHGMPDHGLSRYLALYTAHTDEVLSKGEPSPPPVLGWTNALSLSGRIEPAPKPGPGEVLSPLP